MRSRERPTAPLLLSAAARPAAVAIVVACLLVIAVQAVWLRHGMETGWLDTTIDAKVQAALGGHHLLLAVLVWPGEPVRPSRWPRLWCWRAPCCGDIARRHWWPCLCPLRLP